MRQQGEEKRNAGIEEFFDLNFYPKDGHLLGAIFRSLERRTELSTFAILVYKVLHGCAPSYLGPFAYVADLPSRRGLCSSCSDCLVQPPVHRSTVGSRAFSVAGPQVWNCLPPEVTSAPSLATFSEGRFTRLGLQDNFMHVRSRRWHICMPERLNFFFKDVTRDNKEISLI